MARPGTAGGRQRGGPGCRREPAIASFPYPSTPSWWRRAPRGWRGAGCRVLEGDGRGGGGEGGRAAWRADLDCRPAPPARTPSRRVPAPPTLALKTDLVLEGAWLPARRERGEGEGAAVLPPVTIPLSTPRPGGGAGGGFGPFWRQREQGQQRYPLPRLTPRGSPPARPGAAQLKAAAASSPLSSNWRGTGAAGARAAAGGPDRLGSSHPGRCGALRLWWNPKKMSRRSIRLQAKQQQPLLRREESPQELQAPEHLQTRKRRTAEEIKKREDGKMAKKHQYEIKSCWPPTITGGVSPCIIIETPHKEPVTTDFSRFKKYRFRNLFINPSPLPELNWGNSKDVWLNILKKENRYIHCKHFTSLHPSLQPHMRSILLDWLLEVCEVYALHRETFYLAQDFFDRFMLTQKNINKSMLQLIGITSLFIASKLEEIYAPKIQEFAYVTDGACSEDDIVRMELIMLKALKWELCPVTIVSWLNLYLQVDALRDVPTVLLPQYSQEKFIQIAQLLDLCILDVNSLDFQYRTLAAAALCHYTSIEIVKKASGLDWDSISECVEWMVPFVNVAKKISVKLKNFKKIAVEDRHNIQTHTNYLDMLEEVNSGAAATAPGQLSPVSTGGIITPPKSTEKK
ncbi:G1/S-specific cyclin-E2 [Phaethornis superciliosus]